MHIRFDELKSEIDGLENRCSKYDSNSSNIFGIRIRILFSFRRYKALSVAREVEVSRLQTKLQTEMREKENLQTRANQESQKVRQVCAVR